MSEGLELNTIIQETILKNCEDERTLDFIVECLQYELNTGNQHPPPSEVMGRYELILEKLIRG